jgi:hypothetical protein
MKGVASGLDLTPWDRALVAYRAGETKLIWASDGRHRLFDLAADPAESVDRALRSPAVTSDLARRVEDWLGRPGAAGAGFPRPGAR